MTVEDGRSGSVRYLDLLDVCDFNAGDWNVEVRTVANVSKEGLYIPTMPLMVGILSDFYVSAQVDSELSRVDVHGFAARNEVASAELTPNGLFAVLAHDDLRPFAELPSELLKPVEDHAEDARTFDEWQTVADRIIRAVGELVAVESVFDAEHVERLATGIRDLVMRMYGDRLPATGLEPLFEQLFRRFGIKKPLRAKPGSSVVFKNHSDDEREAVSGHLQAEFFSDDLSVGERVSLYRHLLDDSEALERHRRVRRTLDRATGGKNQATSRRQERLKGRKQASNRRDLPLTQPTETTDELQDSTAPADTNQLVIESQIPDDGTLRALALAPAMDTSSNNIINDFFIPALTHSIHYRRGVGYFTSGWMRIAAKGMVEFASNGGRAEWITSPKLDKDDWEALQRGEAGREDPVIREMLIRDIDELAETLESNTLSALSWMIADGVVSMRIAVPKGKLSDGDFHDKFGVFEDKAGNRLSFNGSYNDSIQGTRNYESIKIFQSWEPSFEPLVAYDERRFRLLWENEDPNVRVVDLPAAAREKLLELRTNPRPYPKPHWIQDSKEPTYLRKRLWNHQVEAVERFLDKERGVLEMATGTGKTRVALTVCEELLNQGQVETVIVSTEGNDLLDQWYSQLLELTKSLQARYAILRQYKGHKEREYFLLEKENTILLTSRQELSAALSDLSKEEANRTLLIHDEVHGLGSPGTREALGTLSKHVRFRMGLSATPEREYDDEGTAFISDQVGPVIFRFGLDDAIKSGILAPFNYFPIAYTPDDNDRERLQAVRKRKAAREAEGNPMSDAELYIELARVYKTSEAKLPPFRDFISKHPELLKRCIIFVETRDYGDKVLPIVHEYRYDFRTYYAAEDADTLRRFASGDIECLLTCHRLSEGIDIRSIETVILFSSARARLETIQRIGRCLRINPDDPDKRANVVDFIRTQDTITDRKSANPDSERSDWLSDLATIDHGAGSK